MVSAFMVQSDCLDLDSDQAKQKKGKQKNQKNLDRQGAIPSWLFGCNQ